eukprot:864899-Amphidinium_carterae.1
MQHHIASYVGNERGFSNYIENQVVIWGLRLISHRLSDGPAGPNGAAMHPALVPPDEKIMDLFQRYPCEACEHGKLGIAHPIRTSFLVSRLAAFH